MMRHKFLWIIDRIEDKSIAKLKLRIKWNGSHNIVTLYSGYNVETAKWIQEAQRCKANVFHGEEAIPSVTINKRIDEYESIAEACFSYFEENGSMPSTDEFKNEFNSRIGKTVAKRKQKSVISLFVEFIDTVSIQNNWSDNTYKMFNTLRRTLEDFIGGRDIGPDDIDDKLLVQFQQYFVRHDYNNSYLRKTMKNMLGFIRWLAKNGYYKGNSHETFRMRLKGIDENHIVVYLTWEELLRVFDMKLDDNGDREVRDIFCFCCFTSLRYSDVMKLQRCDVKDTYIEVVTEKTSESLQIELNNYAKAILRRYEGKHFRHDTVFPARTNQNMNEHLKNIARLAGIDSPVKKVSYSGNKRREKVYEKWQLITTHCGRRTFIVNALYLGIPAEVIIKWTGHADYKAMKPYIAIVDDLKKREMSKFNKDYEG